MLFHQDDEGRLRDLDAVGCAQDEFGVAPLERPDRRHHLQRAWISEYDFRGLDREDLRVGANEGHRQCDARAYRKLFHEAVPETGRDSNIRDIARLQAQGLRSTNGDLWRQQKNIDLAGR